MERVIDAVFKDRLQSAILSGVVILLVVTGAREFLNWARVCVNNSLEQKVLVSRCVATCTTGLLALPVSFYDSRRAGDIATRVTEEVQNVERVIIDGTEQGVIAVNRARGDVRRDALAEPGAGRRGAGRRRRSRWLSDRWGTSNGSRKSGRPCARRTAT